MVSFDTNQNEEKLIEEDKGHQENILSKLLANPKAKKNIRRFALLVVVGVYTSLGAFIFQLLEYNVDVLHINKVRDELYRSRSNFLDHIQNNSHDKKTFLDIALSDYEAKVEECLNEGVSPSFLNLTVIDPRWTFVQSLFFAATVLTTIGYGNIAPSTHWGRIYCIFFALIGIPLTLTMIADMGEVLASFLPTNSIKKLLPKGRLKSIVTIVGTFGLLLLFIAIGGGLFWWFEDWTFLDAFYFCFITTTTIGFGDLVPAPSSLLVCGLYIMVGLALTSTVIELVRRQYAASWDRMKQITLRIHQLSGPLAIAMRKMAETGSGEMEVDTALVRELQELNSALSEVQEKENNNKNKRSPENDPWQALLDMAAKKKKIAVYMYESSV